MLTPKQRVPAKTPSRVPPPPDSPLPQLRGFEGKQSGGAGSVAEPGLRTPPVGPVTQRGKGGGGQEMRSPTPPSPNTPPALPRPLTPGPGRTPRRAPRLCRHSSSPEQPRRWRCVEGCGLPAARPPPLSTPSGGPRTAPPRLQGERSSRGLGGAAQEPGFPGQPASPAERARGRGAAAGKSDPTTSASVQARPKLSVGGGGAGGSSGAWRRSRPRTGLHEGPPLPEPRCP